MNIQIDATNWILTKYNYEDEKPGSYRLSAEVSAKLLHGIVRDFHIIKHSFKLRRELIATFGLVRLKHDKFKRNPTFNFPIIFRSASSETLLPKSKRLAKWLL